MTWCARCDELTIGAPGEACPSCGEPTIETARPISSRRSSTQVLEVKAPSVVLDEASIETIADIQPRRRGFRSRVMAALVAAAVAGGVFVATRPDPIPTPKAIETTAPSIEPTVEAPAPARLLGEPQNGSAVFVGESELSIVDLATGVVRTYLLGLPAGAMAVAASPDGTRVAVTLGNGTLKVFDVANGAGSVVATEVGSFAWTPDGKSLLVARTQLDIHDRNRTRIELISAEAPESRLLLERFGGVGNILSRGGTNLVTFYTEDFSVPPSVYEVLPGKLRLVQKDAMLLDLSPDGRKALVTTLTQRLSIVDIASRSSKPVGAKNFVAQAARFAPDGKSAAVVGTKHFTLEQGCDGEGAIECPVYVAPIDQNLWNLDVKSLKLRLVQPWSTANVVNAPVYGPDGWVFLQLGDAPVAVSMTHPDRKPVQLTGSFARGWLSPDYLPES